MTDQMPSHQSRLAKAVDWIQAAAAGKERLLVALDGRCASGKSTLAAALAKELDCTVFHMDDFFLRPEQRTPARLAIPGENVDHERFLSEVLAPLQAGGSVVYRPFDCHTQTLLAPITVQPRAICLVEGSYACHPALREAYHLRLFSDIDPVEQLRRIRLRDGEAKASVFQARWIPLEEAYFEACRVEACCHACLKDRVNE